MDDKDLLYKVIFNQSGKLYEIYAKYISEESLLGFIEVDELVFNQSDSGLIVDPGEERLKNEFKNVQRFYIPMHNLVRIDEVTHKGVAKIHDTDAKSGSITYLQKQFKPKEKP